MKKIIFLLLLLITINTSVYAQLSLDNPNINVALLNQDPDPVGPGDYVDVRFKISNTNYNSAARNLEVKIDPRFPYNLAEDEIELKVLGDLSAVGDESNVLIVKYKLKVDENAIQGAQPVRLMYRHDGLSWITKEFDLDIQTVDANLAIISVETDPKRIKPGDAAEVKIKVKNMADSTMEDITMKLDLTFSDLLDSATTTTASDSITTFNSLPFAPLGSATEQKIFKLQPGEEKEFSYNLIAFSDAESKVYKVPIVVTYYDELENLFTKNDVIGLIVGTKPDMSIVIDQNDLYVGKKSGDIGIRFINKGFSDLKFLDITLEDSDEYEVLSAKEVYIGNVDSDDYETAEFKLYLTNGATKQEKTIVLPLQVEYRDANNNLYQEQIDLDLKVLEAEKLGIQQGSGGTGFVVILVLAVGGFIYYRRRKKKRK